MVLGDHDAAHRQTLLRTLDDRWDSAQEVEIALDERGKLHAEANNKARMAAIDQAQYGWDASPISLARIAAELWPLIKNEDWSFVSPQGFVGNWPNRLWKMEKIYHYLGGQGAGGVTPRVPGAGPLAASASLRFAIPPPFTSPWIRRPHRRAAGTGPRSRLRRPSPPRTAASPTACSPHPG